MARGRLPDPRSLRRRERHPGERDLGVAREVRGLRREAAAEDGRGRDPALGRTDWAHPEIEFVSADGPLRWNVSGIPALAEAWREFLDTWDGWRVEAEDYRELDDERVLVLIRIAGRGKASGLEVDQISAQGANLFHIREGKVKRLALYWNRQRALADLGLSPEPGSAAGSA